MLSVRYNKGTMASKRENSGKLNKHGDARGMLSTATQFKDGNAGGGRKQGQRNYATIYRLALEKIADAKGMSADDIEMAIVIKGIEKAIRGDYKFSENILDRIHGKPVQTNLNKAIDDVELDEAEVGTLDAMLAKFIKPKKNDSPTKPKRKGNTKKK
jgi:hypothetical protein